MLYTLDLRHWKSNAVIKKSSNRKIESSCQYFSIEIYIQPLQTLIILQALCYKSDENVFLVKSPFPITFDVSLGWISEIIYIKAPQSVRLKVEEHRVH